MVVAMAALFVMLRRPTGRRRARVNGAIDSGVIDGAEATGGRRVA